MLIGSNSSRKNEKTVFLMTSQYYSITLAVVSQKNNC
jgi:hypothetical protein